MHARSFLLLGPNHSECSEAPPVTKLFQAFSDNSYNATGRFREPQQRVLLLR